MKHMLSLLYAIAFGFSLAIVYERTTPPGGLDWKIWAALSVVYFGMMLATKNAS